MGKGGELQQIASKIQQVVGLVGRALDAVIPPLLTPVLIALINVVVAAIVGVATHDFRGQSLAFAAALAAIGALMSLQVVLWAHAHRHLPLSVSYPMTTLMYPGFALVGYWQSRSMTWQQALGVALIVGSVAWFTYDSAIRPGARREDES